MQVIKALNNIQEALKLYKGTAYQHEVLSQSFKAVADAVLQKEEQLPEVPPAEEVKED